MILDINLFQKILKLLYFENGKPYSCKNLAKAIKTAARNIVKILEKLTKMNDGYRMLRDTQKILFKCIGYCIKPFHFYFVKL